MVWILASKNSDEPLRVAKKSGTEAQSQIYSCRGVGSLRGLLTRIVRGSVNVPIMLINR